MKHNCGTRLLIIVSCITLTEASLWRVDWFKCHHIGSRRDVYYISYLTFLSCFQRFSDRITSSHLYIDLKIKFLIKYMMGLISPRGKYHLVMVLLTLMQLSTSSLMLWQLATETINSFVLNFLMIG